MLILFCLVVKKLYFTLLKFNLMLIQPPRSYSTWGMELVNHYHDYVMLISVFASVLVLYLFAVSMLLSKFATIDSHVLETIWTVVPMVILLFIAFPSLYLFYLMEDVFTNGLESFKIGIFQLYCDSLNDNYWAHFGIEPSLIFEVFHDILPVEVSATPDGLATFILKMDSTAITWPSYTFPSTDSLLVDELDESFGEPSEEAPHQIVPESDFSLHFVNFPSLSPQEIINLIPEIASELADISVLINDPQTLIEGLPPLEVFLHVDYLVKSLYDISLRLGDSAITPASLAEISKSLIDVGLSDHSPLGEVLENTATALLRASEYMSASGSHLPQN